jgi:hypothetical protein
VSTKRKKGFQDERKINNCKNDDHKLVCLLILLWGELNISEGGVKMTSAINEVKQWAEHC